jgi:transcriptional regulator with XRE-family HTH domain
MLTRIREVLKAKGLTLHDVAARCVPPTTAQTIGRLETGTRTVSVGWLNRIAAALATPTPCTNTVLQRRYSSYCAA